MTVTKGSLFEAGHRANIRVGSVVIRCVRFDELVAFWQAALGYVPRDPPQDGCFNDRFAQGTVPPLTQVSVRAREQFPVSLGDDVDRAVDHFDGGLVVDRVRGA
jgi:hypothetical protein